MGIGLSPGTAHSTPVGGSHSGYGLANQNNLALANQAYAQNQTTYQQQQAQVQLLKQQYNQAFRPKPYRFNGFDMDADEFVNTIYPDDCPEKTYLLLKMEGNKK